MQELLTQLPPWAVSLSIMVLMVALGLVVHSIAYAIALRIARRTARKLDELFIEHSRAPARLLFPLAFIIFAWSAIPPSPEIAFAGERILGVLFIVGIVAVLLHKLDVRRGTFEHVRRSAIIRRITYGTLYLSTGLVFAAALATDQAADALEFASAGMKDASVLIKSGTTLQVLQWITFGFSMLFTLAVPLLVRSKEEAQAYKEEV